MPNKIIIADYPELRLITWSMPDAVEMDEDLVLATYERNWRYVDQSRLTSDEKGLIQRLVDTYGNGVLHV